MKLNLLFPFFKNKAESNSEDKLLTSFASRRSSAWSYSYDLYITNRYEEATKMATKSKPPFETGAEDKYSSEFNLAEDLDDDFIFHSDLEIDEPTMIERIANTAAEIPNKINQKSREDYIPDPKRNLEPPGKVSGDGSFIHAKCVRLSQMQNENSWLGRITSPFPKEKKDDMKPKQKEKQGNKYLIQAGVIEYLLQFIQKTAIPAIQKYEQMQRKYCNEIKEWTEKVGSLERQNSVLKSELQTADRCSRDAEEELNNLKKFFSGNQPLVKGNFVHVPTFNEIRKSIDLNIEGLPMPVVKPCRSFERDCAGKKEEFIDSKLGYRRLANDVEPKRIAALDESQICREDFTNVKKKLLDQADTMKLERKIHQESLKRRHIFVNSKNKILPKGSENKDDSAHFWSSCGNAQQEHHIEPASSEEKCLFSKLDQFTPSEGTFTVEASRAHGGCGCERKQVQEGAITSLPCVNEWPAGTKLPWMTPHSLKMKEKTEPKTVSINPQVLAASNSWNLQNRDGAAGALNSRSLKVETARRFLNSQKMCQVGTQSLDSRNQYRMTNNRKVNKSIPRSGKISMWL